MVDLIKADWAKRPWWMTLVFYFCLYMTFVYMPWDIFVKPVAQDQEVWFGYQFTGWWAKALAPPHWLIYGAGAWGLYHMSRWMWPWAAVYVGQIVIAMFVFTWLYGGNVIAAFVVAGLFSVLMVAFWRARDRFQS